jgi:predicted ATPase
MNEKITIKNFGGLDEVKIPLNSINIFIGKQAFGKSVSAKLIYFLRTYFEDIFLRTLDRQRKNQIAACNFHHFGMRRT